jgi:hypothetical protein
MERARAINLCAPPFGLATGQLRRPFRSGTAVFWFAVDVRVKRACPPPPRELPGVRSVLDLGAPAMGDISLPFYLIFNNCKIV